jgi:carboxymethylenebutenolidase
MCDEETHPIDDPRFSRRDFAALGAVAAGAAVLGGPNWGVAAVPVTEKDVEITTPDGKCDAALFYPTGAGSWPAVLVWPDIMSLRPEFRDIGKRLAGEGYVVLIPNIYYRAKKAPVVGPGFNFATDRAQLPATAPIDASDRDSIAFVAFLDAQPQTNKAKKMGVQGYCFGGPLTFRTAANQASRIGGAASFHGGGLVTAAPTSPHALIPRTNAEFLVAVAKNDDTRQPTAKDDLKKAFEAASKTAHVEVFNADHGWCVAGSAVYNQAEADRAWALLLGVYKRRLA